MLCPSCNNPLIVLELHEIEIDYCTDCEGIWLDEGELDLMLEDSQQKDTFLKSFKQSSELSEVKLKCPICKVKMNKVEVEGVKPIIIDECKNLCGLWFDKGELLEIVKLGHLDKKNTIITILEEMFKNKINN